MKQTMQLILSLSLLMIVSSCGFHLRGQSDSQSHASNARPPIYVQAGKYAQNMQREIILALQLLHFPVVEEPKDADYQLIIIESNYKQNAIGIDELGRNNEFELSLSIKYLIIPNQKNILSSDEVVQEYSFDHQLEQSLYIDASDIIGKRAELKMSIGGLHQKMNDYLVAHLSRFITQYSATKGQQ